jgi:hypothetical protein
LYTSLFSVTRILSNPLNDPLPPFLLPLSVAKVIDCICIRNQIDLPRVHKRRPLPDLPNDKHAQHNRQLEIKAHETNTVKCRAKTAPPLYKHDDYIQDHADPGTYRVREVAKRQQVCLVLLFQCGAEPDAGYTDRDP